MTVGLPSGRAVSGRRLRRRFGRYGPGLLAAVLAAAVYGLSSADERLAVAPSPLFLLIVPLALVAVAYGVYGGIGFGLLAAALACGWWLQHGQMGGTLWLVSRVLTALLIGGSLGWIADSRQTLMREIAEQREWSLDLIAAIDYEGRFTSVNPAFTRTLGYDGEELLARACVEFIHPDDRGATAASFAAQSDDGREVVNLQNRFRAKDGAYRWLEWSSRRDPHRRVLVAVARDITDRKLLEAHEQQNTVRLEGEVVERTRQLEEARQETLVRLALTAEYHDNETRRHTSRVGEIAALLAGRLGLAADDVALIREAAQLHDVGKVGVTDTVLLKPGRLTPEEFEQMKQHTAIGARILSGSTSEVLKAAEQIAYFHHERWDGNGYPLGLAGEAIPLFARIVAVADVFDAITHTRHYKQARSVTDAASEIIRLAGRQFDPRVVDAFVALDAARLALIAAADAVVPDHGAPHGRIGADPSSDIAPPAAAGVRSRTVGAIGAAEHDRTWRR